MRYLKTLFLAIILLFHGPRLVLSEDQPSLHGLADRLQEEKDSRVNIFELDRETYWKEASILPSDRHSLRSEERLKAANRSESVDTKALKFYAFYFPQWYKTPENRMQDDWRYLEFTRLVKNGKDIPIVRPKNHIYYDPRHFITRLTQRNLANKYGIDGFIFYHYWFDMPLLGDVVELLLLDGEPAVEFALLWVNEEFGGVSPQYRDPLRHALYLSRFMKHPNYIHIDDRPILYIYHTKAVPRAYLDSLVQYLVRMGHPSPYLIQCLQLHGDNMSLQHYVDGYAEFPPNIHSPDDVQFYKVSSFQLGLTLNYDNTPRITQGKVVPGRPVPINPTKGRQLFDKFRDRKTVTDICTRKIREWYPVNDGPKIVVIFAWNEWSEQAALEPSDLIGYQMLEAIQDCRSTWNTTQSSVENVVLKNVVRLENAPTSSGEEITALQSKLSGVQNSSRRKTHVGA